MKKFIFIIAVLALGCKTATVFDSRHIVAVDTLYAENPASPGTYFARLDSVVVEVKTSYWKKKPATTSYRVINK